jgi:putative selenate reductase molybdopterin-binding subunit
MGETGEVGRSVPKIDALSLATGTERFTADFAVEDPVWLALLYSPHAHAEITHIDTSSASKVPGVVDILHHGNVPRILHTTAGQGYPEPSPYDTCLFERKVRFVGDRVALVAAETLDIARKAVRLIQVEYNQLDPMFDPERATEKGAPLLHTEDEHILIPATYDPGSNLAARIDISIGNVEEGFSEADFIEEHEYSLQYASHCAMEPHAAVAAFDERGRLVIFTTTQVPFHARRITSMLLGIPIGMMRVVKPRIGGGFGGKQEVLFEPLVALVAWKHKRAAKLVLSRQEVFISTRTRHPMRIRLKTGVKNNGALTALELDGLLNAGAYGSHALTVLSNVGSKVLPLFNKVPNIRFFGRSVYTNLPVGGAYRGYGATQGYFALNQQIDMISRRTGQDFLDWVKRWHIRTGETSEVFKALGEGKEGVAQTILSCKLDECVTRGAEEIGWNQKRGKRIRVGKDRVKGVGAAVCMQGSGIPQIDMASAAMMMNEDGSFNLYIGATDIGTGSDTILAQIAAEVLAVPTEKIIVLSSDTDLTPFDTGAYASSTTYVSGRAVQQCALKLREQILDAASKTLQTESGSLTTISGKVRDPESGREVSYEEIVLQALYGHDQFQPQASASYTPTQSPPPFIAQFAEVDVDRRTGRVEIVKFVSCADCGVPINPKLAEGQIEGAAVNGISYALCEDYSFDSSGRMTNPSFWDYKIFTAADIPEIVTILVDSFEESGPFGAKSAGEVAINGPPPAIANAVYDAVGIRIYDLPITPQKVWEALKEEESG